MEIFFVIYYVGVFEEELMTKIKTISKLLAVCMCMAIFANTPIVSYAAVADGSDVANPCATYIIAHSVGLDVSTGTANVSGSVTGVAGVTESYVKCNLEKLMGSYWMQLKSWDNTVAGTFASVSGSLGIGEGMYRVMLTARCNTETKTAYSSNKTYSN